MTYEICTHNSFRFCKSIPMFFKFYKLVPQNIQNLQINFYKFSNDINQSPKIKICKIVPLSYFEIGLNFLNFKKNNGTMFKNK